MAAQAGQTASGGGGREDRGGDGRDGISRNDGRESRHEPITRPDPRSGGQAAGAARQTARGSGGRDLAPARTGEGTGGTESAGMMGGEPRHGPSRTQIQDRGGGRRAAGAG